MVNHGLVSRQDMELIRFMDTPEEAFRHLKKFLTEKYLRQKKGNGGKGNGGLLTG